METVEKKIRLQGVDMFQFSGHADANLNVLESRFEAIITLRGDTVTIKGEPAEIAALEKIIGEMIYTVQRNNSLSPKDVETIVDLVSGGRAGSGIRGEKLDDVILVGRSATIRAKGERQKEYYRLVRENDIVFSIGAAGTGKTFLAIAMAVAAWRNREVTKLVLARPAVEAGESLGFLPGDLKEKIDPYLRPLYDALEEMMPADKLKTMMERGGIEVVPLAYMRGRAQPVQTPVLTPSGYRPIGSLSTGDEVIGSNGRPTRVTGVYPQGVKEIFRVTTSDGASTLCCGEHLWTVYTASDKRRGHPPRTLQTREMIGSLRCAHAHRYELPLISAPVAFPAQEVPIDPYALGLLLGDGCITGATTPGFATRDRELVVALGERLPSVVMVQTSRVDYRLSRNDGYIRRHEHPLYSSLRPLGLRGTRSATKFIPEIYLLNEPEIRIALLQGLLDTDGGPVTQAGRTCRIQYTTTSPRLRDDVLFLVRSLGGVAYWRTRQAEERKPGWANGRAVGYRNDAFTLEIRMPEGIAPFRLARKQEIYDAHGGGRPMRHITSIEPVGHEEAVCISVDAADHLYVTEDFLVTHNTLNSAFIILDEAQNATALQMKMFLTRIGANSRAIITGDLTQVDLPRTVESGLRQATDILRGIEGIGFIEFQKEDVVRHKLVKDIIDAYEKHGVAGGL